MLDAASTKSTEAHRAFSSSHNFKLLSTGTQPEVLVAVNLLVFHLRCLACL